MWTRPQEVEPSAMQQLQNIAALPWVVKHVAVMPDVHFGKGATVGSVIALRDAVSPAAVGVDIGCGMAAVRTSLTANDLPDSLRRLRTRLEAVVPVGFAQHREPAFTDDDANDWTSFWKMFDDLTPVVKARADKALRQMGTLGGGNHFVEVCLDSDDHVWVMLHSGSRGIGNQLAQHHISVARGLAHNAELPDPDLAVFLAGTQEMAAYRHDLYWAQDYARRNRTVMLRLVCDVLRAEFGDIGFETPISCHHNYVAEERHFGEDVLVLKFLNPVLRELVRLAAVELHLVGRAIHDNPVGERSLPGDRHPSALAGPRGRRGGCSRRDDRQRAEIPSDGRKVVELLVADNRGQRALRLNRHALSDDLHRPRRRRPVAWRRSRSGPDPRAAPGPDAGREPRKLGEQLVGTRPEVGYEVLAITATDTRLNGVGLQVS